MTESIFYLMILIGGVALGFFGAMLWAYLANGGEDETP